MRPADHYRLLQVSNLLRCYESIDPSFPMNERPDYVTENWLRCLGLSGKAAKAVMDVHTDQLNALRSDVDRLKFASELVKLPTASFHFQDDEAMAEEAGMPMGYTVRIDESCREAIQVSADTFAAALDKVRARLAEERDEFEDGTLSKPHNHP